MSASGWRCGCRRISTSPALVRSAERVAELERAGCVRWHRPRSRPPRRDDSGAARSGGNRLSHAAAGARRERPAPRPVPASGHGAAPHIRLHEHDRRVRRHGRRCRGRKQRRAAADRSRAPPRQCRRNDASLVQRAARAPRRAARAGDLWAGSPAARALAARRASRARARGRHEQPHPRRRPGRSLRALDREPGSARRLQRQRWPAAQLDDVHQHGGEGGRAAGAAAGLDGRSAAHVQPGAAVVPERVAPREQRKDAEAPGRGAEVRGRRGRNQSELGSPPARR